MFLVEASCHSSLPVCDRRMDRQTQLKQHHPVENVNCGRPPGAQESINVIYREEICNFVLIPPPPQKDARMKRRCL